MSATFRKPWRPAFVLLASLAALAAIGRPARAQAILGPYGGAYTPYGMGGTAFPIAGYVQPYQGAAFPLYGLSGGLPASRYTPRPELSGRFLDRGLIENTPAGGGTSNGLPLSYTQRRIEELVDQPDTITRNADARLLELRLKKDRLYVQAQSERDPRRRAAMLKEYEALNRQVQRGFGSVGRTGTATALRGSGPAAPGSETTPSRRPDRYGSPGWFARHPVPLTRNAPGYPAPKDPPPPGYVPPAATARVAPAPAAGAPAARPAAAPAR